MALRRSSSGRKAWVAAVVINSDDTASANRGRLRQNPAERRSYQERQRSKRSRWKERAPRAGSRPRYGAAPVRRARTRAQVAPTAVAQERIVPHRDQRRTERERDPERRPSSTERRERRANEGSNQRLLRRASSPRGMLVLGVAYVRQVRMPAPALPCPPTWYPPSSRTRWAAVPLPASRAAPRKPSPPPYRYPAADSGAGCRTHRAARRLGQK